MSHKPTAIVLGGTVPHIALIENLKSRGYYVILVDYYECPPAKKYCDRHIKESTLDEEKVLNIAISNKVDLVISACIDQANLTACYVAEKLKLPKPYSYKTAQSVTNKEIMKRMMRDAFIPTSKHIKSSEIYNINDIDLKYPVIVKPTDCCGSAGVKRANSGNELRKYISDAKSFSRSGNAIIEEFTEGLELSIYSFVENHRVKILMTAERLTSVDPENKVIKCVATLAPASLNIYVEDKIQNIANDIAKSFNLNNTPLHIQVIVNKENVSVIEFAPRIGGGVSYETIKTNTGFDIMDATVDSFLGKKVAVECSKPRYHIAVGLIYAIPSIFGYISEHSSLIAEGIIDKLFPYKSEGSKIESDKAASGRVGSFISKAQTRGELLNKVHEANQRLNVYDQKNVAIMDKNLLPIESNES